MRVGIVGCGAMGSAFALRLADYHSLLLYSRDASRVAGLTSRCSAKAAASLSDLVSGSDLILLAVLPSSFDEVASLIAPLIGSHHTVVSILSGCSVEALQAGIPEAGRHFQVMPNLGIQVGCGVIAVEEHSGYTEGDRQLLEELLAPLGHLFWASQEKMRAMSVVSGSSPAFFALYLEAMVDAAVAMGISAHEALPLLLKTVEGTVALMEQEGVSPAVLRQRVAAPGGTTIAGVCAFEREGGRSAVIEAALATYRKRHG